MLKLAITMTFGIVGGRVARRLSLPNVTGYLILGLFLGPSFFGLIKESDVDMVNFVNELALACIAFAIGGEFLLSDMKRLGKDIFVITLGEVLGVLLLVFFVMYFLLGKPFAFSIVIASMSAATAPAGTMMVIRQYRAYGPLTNTILPVAALDDALGIMVFGVALSLAKMSMGTETISFLQMVAGPLVQIIASIILGIFAGVLFSYLIDRVKAREELLFLVLCFIVGVTGLSNDLGLSSLLANMALGALVVNRTAKSKRIFMAINDFTPPINLLFFTLAGASLNLSVLASIGGLGLIYVLSRAAGKIFGATAGAHLVGADQVIKKYLGIALLPQGGISIGLSMIVSRQLPSFRSEIVTLILFSVLIFEVSGPILAKYAISKAREVDGIDKKGV